MEHEHEAAPSAPVAAPVIAPAAAGGGPLLTDAFTPAHVLSLQKTAGNRAVTSILARDGTPPDTPVTGPADFGHTGITPAATGTATVTPKGADMARIQAPRVTLDGEAWVLDGKALGASAYLGVIQNLAHSDRAAVYRHGGDPNGEIVAEVHEGEANRRDAVSDPAAEAKGKLEPGTFAPFYWQPGNIDDTNRAGTPAKPTRLGTPYDQPEFSVPVSHGAGRITAFKGSDTFKVGLAVKQDASTWVLSGATWTASWDAPVDAAISGAGKAVQTQPIQDLLKDGPDPSLKDWSLTPNSGSVFEGFSTQADAMKRTPAELMKWLFAARQFDPTSYKNICDALDAKAPKLAAKVHCDTTDVTFGKDVVSASVLRNGALISSEGSFSLNNGEDHVIELGWADAIGSAAGLTPGTAITIAIYVGGERLEATGTIPYPFEGTRGGLAPGSGKYAVSLALT